MRWPSLRLLGALGGIGVLAGVLLLAVLGGDPPAGARPWTAATVAVPQLQGGDDARAVAALRRAASADDLNVVTGTVRVRDWGTTSVRLQSVTRQPGDKALGQPSWWPDRATMLAVLLDRYQIDWAGAAKVAGRAVDVVVARTSGARAHAMFWIDHATGVLLRREAYGPTGDVAASTEFSAVRIRRGARPAAASSPAWPGDTALQPAAVARLRTEGWPCPQALPAGLTLVAARDADDGVVHLVYTDGVGVVSLFVQHGRLAASPPAGMRADDVGGATVYRGDGTPARRMWEAGTTVVTAIADAPPDVVDEVVSVLSAPAVGGDDLTSRIGRGLSRVVSGLTQ